jgi:hypothetical protein
MPFREGTIPGRVRAILASWGLAVLLLAGILSYWIWSGERQKDQAMCDLTAIFLSDPEPVPGPAGDRSRAVRAGMLEYREKLGCR